MKTTAIAVAFLISALSLFSLTAAAEDDCINACDQDYKACKEIAESGTAKQACEDDAKACKADCK